jgi:hypothetical protein
MEKSIKRILIETGSNNVKNIEFDEQKGEWVVTYLNNLNPDSFEYFDDLLLFLKTEGNPEGK